MPRVPHWARDRSSQVSADGLSAAILGPAGFGSRSSLDIPRMPGGGNFGEDLIARYCTREDRVRYREIQLHPR